MEKIRLSLSYLRLKLGRLRVCWAILQALSGHCLVDAALPFRNDVIQIPQTDRSLLNLFFQQILYSDRAIYVLCGSKPMGMLSYSSLPIAGEEEEHNRIKREGWETWCRYRHLFPSKKLVMRSIGDEKDDARIIILLLHRAHFEEVLEKHRAIFEKTLNKEINIEELVSHFEWDANPFESVLGKDHILTGILFGYGIQNSQAFAQRMDMDPSKKSPFGPEVIEMLIARNDLFTGEKKIESLHLSQLHHPREKFCKKMEKLCRKTSPRNAQKIRTVEERDPRVEILQDDENHPVFGLPVFAADPNLPETKALQKKYSEERREILKKYQGRDLLDVFIENL
jgi:hypothetical protein